MGPLSGASDAEIAAFIKVHGLAHVAGGTPLEGKASPETQRNNIGKAA